MHDTDSGLGIGGINNDQQIPAIPTVQAIKRVQQLRNTDTVCRRCGASKNFDGAMFTTLAGSNICDDCV
jgi:predicted molibdopterin-dependent oxidoreductase YjgC